VPRSTGSLSYTRTIGLYSIVVSPPGGGKCVSHRRDRPLLPPGYSLARRSDAVVKTPANASHRVNFPVQ